jgi:adenylyl- and sulfurtransferase ThiI
VFVDSDDWRRSMELLSTTFGVVSFSPATKVSSDLESLKKDIVDFAEPLMFESAAFALRVRRTGTHPYKSQDLATVLGAAILSACSAKKIEVDLDEPDVEIHVEARDRDAYLFSSILPGPGGMPKGTQGRILSVAETERGLASTWLMMKRGCNVVLASASPEIAEPLRRTWDPDLKVVDVDDDLFSLARGHRCDGLVLEHQIAEIDDLGARKGPVPVFYPLVGMSKDEADALLKRILA